MLLFITMEFSIFAKPKKEPAWIEDYKTIFPEKDYLVQRGTGSDSETAKTEAVSSIGRYLKTELDSSISTKIETVTINNKSNENLNVKTETELKSNVELFAVEFTEPFYRKKEKKWYCVAYINRDKAWNKYSPEIENAKEVFTAILKNIDNETDTIKRISLYKNAWQEGSNFLSLLSYGLLIKPENADLYIKEKQMLSDIPAFIKNEKNNCSFHLSVQNDYGNIITGEIKNILSSCGLILTEDDDAEYLINVEIHNNESGIDPIIIYPSLTLNINNSQSETVFSYSYKSNEKTVAFTIENAQKKAFPKLTKEFENDLSDKVKGIFEIY